MERTAIQHLSILEVLFYVLSLMFSFQILYCKLDPDTEMNPYIQRTTATRKDYDQGEFESVSYFMTFYELCLSTN